MSQGRFKHIAGVNGAFGGAGADNGMNLINKKYYLALCLTHFVHYRLEAFFKLAAELAASHQRSHIKCHHTVVSQGFGDIIGGNFLRHSFGDSRFTHAGFANDHRVILGASGKYLHYPFNFLIPADNRVKLTLTGEFGKVTTVFCQRAVFTLGSGIGNAVSAPYFLQGDIDIFLVYLGVMQYSGCLSLFVTAYGNQKMFGTDKLILEPVGFIACRFQQLGDAGGGVDLLGFIGNLGRFFQCGGNLIFQCLYIGAEFFYNIANQPLFLLQQGKQDMLDIPLAMLELTNQLLGGG